MSDADPKYVLITAVRDEAATIGITIDSMLAQTAPPTEWVIVNDGSTDQTGAIIFEAASRCQWIKHVQFPHRHERSFGAMVAAIKAGRDTLNSQDYEYIGLLDGDLRFRSDYFLRVLQHFKNNPRLGLTGGMVVDVGEDPTRIPHNRTDVPGAVQLFRRSCYEKLNGYLAIPEGGFDAIACAQARMCGFETQLLTELVVEHLKPRNLAAGGQLCRKWQLGVRDYAMGYHPLFETVKCLGRVGERPYLTGTIAWWLGYFSRALKRPPRVVPPSLIAFIQQEQMSRLRTQFRI